jgi:hypothetical protein
MHGFSVGTIVQLCNETLQLAGLLQKRTAMLNSKNIHTSKIVVKLAALRDQAREEARYYRQGAQRLEEKGNRAGSRVLNAEQWKWVRFAHRCQERLKQYSVEPYPEPLECRIGDAMLDIMRNWMPGNGEVYVESNMLWGSIQKQMTEEAAMLVQEQQVFSKAAEILTMKGAA